MATTSTPTSNSPAPRQDSPDSSAVPAVAQPNDEQQPEAPRRTSFNFLRRKNSAETRGSHRSASTGKMSKKAKMLAQEEALRSQKATASLPVQPPRLPSHSFLPHIDSFGGEDFRPDSVAIVSNQAGAHSHPNFSRPSVEHARMTPASTLSVAPPMPVRSPSPSYMDYDPYPRAESMTNRGRYSYASSQVTSINSPRRVRRRKDPTPFK